MTKRVGGTLSLTMPFSSTEMSCQLPWSFFNSSAGSSAASKKPMAKQINMGRMVAPFVLFTLPPAQAFCFHQVQVLLCVFAPRREVCIGLRGNDKQFVAIRRCGRYFG